MNETADSMWDGDRFGSGLTSRLTAVLADERDNAALEMALTECACAAESACSGRLMACAAGCPHCCVLNVAILLPEGIIIADWLKAKLLPAKLHEVQKRLKGHCSTTRWMDDEERIAKSVVCPMLDAAGHCMIHPVRPLACRGVTSLDKNSCREALASGYTDEVRLVPTDLLRKAAFDESFTALVKALRCHGLDNRSIDLGVGVTAFLEQPQYRELFLGGRRLPDELWQ